MYNYTGDTMNQTLHGNHMHIKVDLEPKLKFPEEFNNTLIESNKFQSLCVQNNQSHHCT